MELYTSQGCSSCPAADALLNRLAERDDIIAVSLSVDYWDYLGWKDTLAQTKFTERQKAFAKALGDGMVYTPQVVVNGVAHANGSDERKHFGRHRENQQIHCRLARAGAPVHRGRQAGCRDRHRPPRRSNQGSDDLAGGDQSERGGAHHPRREQGKTVTYSNVVRDLMPIGTWNGKPMTVQLQRHSIVHAGAERCAVLVQQGPAGPIVGAALIKQL